MICAYWRRTRGTVEPISTDFPFNIHRLTYHLQLVLPKLLLPRLVEEWEIPNMIDKDVPEDR
jgi:hypothetical protein